MLADMLAQEFRSGMELPLPIVVLRLVGSAVLCAMIGLEREQTRHPAGLRTNMLVGLAATIFTLITLHMVERFEGQGDAIRLDPIRLVEAVTAGVAFLGAGMIFFSRGEIQGLTTGAMMWCAAGIGVAVGLGLWLVAGLSAVLALIIARLLKRAADAIGGG
jgi:putative Mg2+ transporter-C (MgtC) family protein